MSCLHHQIIFFRNVPTGPDYMLPLPADQTHSPKHTASHSRKSEALATPLLLAPILQIFRQISERESDTADCHTAVRMKTNFAAHVKTLKCCNDKSIALVGCGGGGGDRCFCNTIRADPIPVLLLERQEYVSDLKLSHTLPGARFWHR